MKSQLIALAAAALLAAAGVSQAQDLSTPAPASGGGGSGGGNSAVRDACMSDVMKLCPSVNDRDSFRQCIIDHYSDLSDGCKSAITAMRSQMQSGGSH